MHEPCLGEGYQGSIRFGSEKLLGFASLSNLSRDRLGLSEVFFSIVRVVFAQVNRRADGFFKTTCSGRGHAHGYCFPTPPSNIFASVW